MVTRSDDEKKKTENGALKRLGPGKREKCGEDSS